MNLNLFKNSLILKNFPITNRFSKLSKKATTKNIVIKPNKYGLHISNPFRISSVRPRVKWIKIFEPDSHIKKLFKDLSKKIDLKNVHVIGSYSFKDDVLLDLFKKNKRKIWQISPKDDYKDIPQNSSFETYQDAFEKNINQIEKKYKKSDLFICRHSLEHAYHPRKFLDALKCLLKKNSYLLIEIPDSEHHFNNGSLSVFWEEHISYFSYNSIKNLFYDAGFRIVFSKRYSLSMEDSLVFLIQLKKNFNFQIKKTNFDLVNYYKAVLIQKDKFIKFLKKNNEKKIYFYGVGHSGIIFIHLLNIKRFIISLIDDDPNKVNSFSALKNLKILSSKKLDYSKSKICLVSINPENIKNLRRNNKHYISNGGKFFSIYSKEKNFFLKNV